MATAYLNNEQLFDLIAQENALATVRKVCQQCKREFFVRPNQTSRIYCVQRDCTRERHHLKKQKAAKK